MNAQMNGLMTVCARYSSSSASATSVRTTASLARDEKWISCTAALRSGDGGGLMLKFYSQPRGDEPRGCRAVAGGRAVAARPARAEESPDSTERGARRKPGSGNRQLEPQRPMPG